MRLFLSLTITPSIISGGSMCSCFLRIYYTPPLLENDAVDEMALIFC